VIGRPAANVRALRLPPAHQSAGLQIFCDWSGTPTSQAHEMKAMLGPAKGKERRQHARAAAGDSGRAWRPVSRPTGGYHPGNGGLGQRGADRAGLARRHGLVRFAEMIAYTSAAGTHAAARRRDRIRHGPEWLPAGAVRRPTVIPFRGWLQPGDRVRLRVQETRRDPTSGSWPDPSCTGCGRGSDDGALQDPGRSVVQVGAYVPHPVANIARCSSTPTSFATIFRRSPPARSASMSPVSLAWPGRFGSPRG